MPEDSGEPTTSHQSALELLPSDSDEKEVKLVHVACPNGQTKCARVLIQGVEASGIVDTGAEITTIGRNLFLTIATTNKLKKHDLKKPDKVPKNYDRKPFTLDGKLELELSFESKAVVTTLLISCYCM